ncbi:MAG: putative amino acid transporter [Elusimicrobia bacterium]|nr:MAG: putative amino acid transporter [Elusimicrobiota bacterium]
MEMPQAPQPAPGSRRVTKVVVLTTAMLTFISFWRAAAIVLCDMASSAFYVGGIAERAVGPAAPWFILAVMGFSACVLMIYVESSSMFVRGGVYKVVKEAMGGSVAKVSVSALMFDMVMTGPISSVSAGHYLVGLLNSTFPYLRVGWHFAPNSFAVFFALLVTAYFWRQNIRGMEESSDKAVQIMRLMGGASVILLGWGAWTIWTRRPDLPSLVPAFSEDGLGFLHGMDPLRLVGAVGLVLAFGHAFLGMSIIFVFCFVVTSASAFLGVMLIPPDARPQYIDNMLAGVAMWLDGPLWLRIGFRGVIVVVGTLILSGAVNTSIVGANAVMCRVAEDGLLHDWFRHLHPRFGTTHRMIHLVALFQAATILFCGGDVYLLGEAYAFGVTWSFIFMGLSVIMLRYKAPGEQDWKVPLNLRVAGFEVPLGLGFIVGVLIAVGVANLFTKKAATVWGIGFTALFYALIKLSERLNERRRESGDHREKLNLRAENALSGTLDELTKPDRVLVALKNPANMHTLHRVLEETDTDKTDIVVLHSRIARGLVLAGEINALDPDSELLFTRVIAIAEEHGKTVTPLVVVSNDPSYAVAQAAQAVGAREVVIGVSERIGAVSQMEQVAMAWGARGHKPDKPVKVRVLWPDGRRLEADLT